MTVLEQTADLSPFGREGSSEGGSLPGGKTAPRTVYSERLRADILTLRKRGLVPLAIADILDISDHTVYAHLRRFVKAGELEPTPVYFDRIGPEREPDVCRHCGAAQA
jgi:hypothetical protein